MATHYWLGPRVVWYVTLCSGVTDGTEEKDMRTF